MKNENVKKASSRPQNSIKHKNEKDKSRGLSFSKIVLILFVVVLYFGAYSVAVFSVSSANVILNTRDRINSDIDFGYDAIIILGAGVRDDGSMSDMLRDRMDAGIALYHSGVAEKILVTGDHGTDEYDEVNTMKAYAVECGVDSSDVFMDHAGFSTYDSIVRAYEIFGIRRAVIVTQRYHLYRALYIADYTGIYACGVSADPHTYRGQIFRDVRELFARANDSLRRYTRPSPVYLGDKIDISGDGNMTNDK